MEFFRQGDVAILRIDALPEGEAKPVKRDAKRIVLAYGEVTGHAHAIATPGVKLMEVGSERYLTADKPFAITHEEHATVHVPAGTFRVIRQREYSPESIRQIAD
jgi:hypothetical protein